MIKGHLYKLNRLKRVTTANVKEDPLRSKIRRKNSKG